MKFALAIMWLFSDGHTQYDPWSYFPDYQSCDAAVKLKQQESTETKLMFFAGCLRTNRIAQFRAFYMDLHDENDHDEPEGEKK